MKPSNCTIQSLCLASPYSRCSYAEGSKLLLHVLCRGCCLCWNALPTHLCPAYPQPGLCLNATSSRWSYLTAPAGYLPCFASFSWHLSPVAFYCSHLLPGSPSSFQKPEPSVQHGHPKDGRISGSQHFIKNTISICNIKNNFSPQ